MDGFRFWKQGFWKDHLRGHPYHISALYVVDLARFRCAAAQIQPLGPSGSFQQKVMSCHLQNCNCDRYSQKCVAVG